MSANPKIQKEIKDVGQIRAERALEFLSTLDRVPEDKMSEVVRKEIGEDLLGVFVNYVELLFKNVDEKTISLLVNVMATAYLLKCNEDKALFTQKKYSN